MSVQKKRNPAAAVMLACLFALLLLFNCRTGMVADDFMFCFSRAHWGRITSVRDIVISLAALRREVNGRVFSHFFAMLFLLLPKGWFNGINSAVSTLLFYLLYRYVRSGDPRRDTLLLGFLLGAVFLLLPAFGQVFLWLTGACNYSWTMLASFLFLLPFFRTYLDSARPFPQGARGGILRALYLVLAFVTGAWSENGALAVLFAAFCFLLLIWRRERRLPGFLTAALFVGGAGFLFLMLSPSELNGRRGEAGQSLLVRVWSLLTARVSPAILLAAGLVFLALLGLLVVLLFRKTRLGCRLWAALIGLGTLALSLLLIADDLRGAAGPLFAAGAVLSDTRLSLLLAFALFALLFLLALSREVRAPVLAAAAILGLAALASVAIFFFALYFPARSACPAVFYTSLADALLLSALWERGRPQPLRRLTALIALLCVLVLPLAAWDVLHTGSLLEQRRRLLEQAGREQPGTVVCVEPVTPVSKYPACWPGDEDYFVGEMGHFYGLAEVDVSSYVNQEG